MGRIYILTNQSMPGLVKIGHTDREAEERAMELSSSTGVPTSFDIFRAFEVDDASVLERRIHKKLSSFRVNGNREFFRMDAEDASRIIEEELPEQRKVDGVEDGLEESYDREDELLRQATELTKEAPEIWPGKISGALRVSHEKACEIFRTLKERGLIDKNGRCQIYLDAIRKTEEAEQLQRREAVSRQRWIDEESPSRPFTAKEALAYIIVAVGILLAVQANKFEEDKAIVVAVMISAFGVLLIFKFRKG